MTRRLGCLHRMAALSAAIAMFVSPVASAQTPAPTPMADATPKTALLSPAAFAKLVEGPRAAGAPVPVVQDPPRRDLVRQTTAAATRAAALSPQPPRRATGWGQKTVIVLACVGLFVGVAAASFYTGIDFFPILDGLFGGK